MNYITINGNELGKKQIELNHKPLSSSGNLTTLKAYHPGGLALDTLMRIHQTLEEIPFANTDSFINAAHVVKTNYDAKIKKLWWFSKLFACWKIYKVNVAFKNIIAPQNHLRLATQAGTLDDMQTVWNRYQPEQTAAEFVWPALKAALILNEDNKIRFLVKKLKACTTMSSEILSLILESRHTEWVNPKILDEELA